MSANWLHDIMCIGKQLNTDPTDVDTYACAHMSNQSHAASTHERMSHVHWHACRSAPFLFYIRMEMSGLERFRQALSGLCPFEERERWTVNAVARPRAGNATQPPYNTDTQEH